MIYEKLKDGFATDLFYDSYELFLFNAYSLINGLDFFWTQRAGWQRTWGAERYSFSRLNKSDTAVSKDLSIIIRYLPLSLRSVCVFFKYKISLYYRTIKICLSKRNALKGFQNTTVARLRLNCHHSLTRRQELKLALVSRYNDGGESLILISNRSFISSLLNTLLFEYLKMQN